MTALKRRFGLIGIGSAFALLTLEVVLQLVSFSIWLASNEDVVHDDGSRVVLCVGDSFTEGMGASSAANSYPRKLETVLAEREQPWRVYNCGLSGSSSRKLLEKLPRQLDTYRPNVLCILTGYNDFWDKPEPLPEGEITKIPDGYNWELKLWKLGKMIVHAVSDDSADNTSSSNAAALPFLGAWHSGSAWFRFLPSGRVETEARDFYWFVDGDKLELRLPTEGKGLEATWKLQDGKLVLAGGLFPTPVELSKGMPERDDADRGRNALDAGDYDEAVSAYRRAVEVPASELRAREGLVRALWAAGRRADAKHEVEGLQARFDAKRNDAVGDALARAYIEIEDVDQAIAVASSMLVDQPVTIARLSFLLEHALATRDPSTILPFIDSALKRDGLKPALRASLFGGKAQLSKDPLVSFACLLEAWRSDPKDWLVHKTVLADPEKYSRSNLDKALATMGLTSGQESSIRSVYAGTFKLENRTTEILAGHLRRIAELGRAAGAEPVFLIYPVSKPEVEQAVKMVAAEMTVPWVDVRKHFNKLLVTERYEDLFVLDGHCNDRGYQALAKLVAETVR